jgi:hypothetical protein
LSEKEEEEEEEEEEEDKNKRGMNRVYYESFSTNGLRIVLSYAWGHDEEPYIMPLRQ